MSQAEEGNCHEDTVACERWKDSCARPEAEKTWKEDEKYSFQIDVHILNFHVNVKLVDLFHVDTVVTSSGLSTGNVEQVT